MSEQSLAQVTAFHAQVSDRLLQHYGISWQDACGDTRPLRSAIDDGLTPDLFVIEFARKYGLEPVQTLRY